MGHFSIPTLHTRWLCTAHTHTQPRVCGWSWAKLTTHAKLIRRYCITSPDNVLLCLLVFQAWNKPSNQRRKQLSPGLNGIGCLDDNRFRQLFCLFDLGFRLFSCFPKLIQCYCITSPDNVLLCLLVFQAWNKPSNQRRKQLSPGLNDMGYFLIT